MPEALSSDMAKIAEQEALDKLRDIEKVKKIGAATIKEALLLVDKLQEQKDQAGKPSQHKWVKEAVQNALSQMEQSKQPFVEVTDGTNIQKEGVPVDDLIDSLLQGVDQAVLVDVYPGGNLSSSIDDIRNGMDKVADLDITNVDQGENSIIERIDFILANNHGACSEDDIHRLQLAKQLIEASERYGDLNRGQDSSADKDWRVRLESSFIAGEGDFRHQKLDEEGIRDLAENYLKKRREVFVAQSEYSKSGDQLTDAKLTVGGDKEKSDSKPVEKSEEDGKMTAVTEEGGNIVANPDNENEKIVVYKPGEEHMIPYVKPEELAAPTLEGSEPVPSEEPEPVPTPDKKERIILADASEIAKAMAWRVAENRLNEIVHYDNGPTPPRFWGMLWKGVKGLSTPGFWKAQFAKMGEQGYLTKFYREALSEIEGNQDLMTDIRGRLLGESEIISGAPEKGEHYRLLDAVVREVENEVLEAEESGEDLTGRGEIFSELINRHMLGEFGDDRNAFEAAARETIQQAIADGEINQNQFSIAGRAGDAEGLLYASNLWDIAKRYKASALEEVGALSEGELTPEQREALQGVIGGIGELDIRLATKYQDLNESRARRPGSAGGFLSIWERAASFSRSRTILGAVANPTVVGFFAGLGTRTALRNSALFGAGVALAGGSLIGTFGLPLAVGAGIAGTMAYINRRRNLTFDRGMEQRREAIGQQGEGSRAERIREFGFSGIAENAEELTAEINSGNESALLRASALLQAERLLRNDGRPVDLVWGSRDEGDATRSNLAPKVDLKVAIRENAPEGDPEWQARVDNLATTFIERVREDDSRFERFRVREGLKAAASTALAAGTLGAITQEAIHGIEWHINSAAAAERVTLLDYVTGHRNSSVEFAQIGETQYPAEFIQTDENGMKFINVNTATATDGKVVGGFIHMMIGPDGAMRPDMSKSFIPEGFTYNPESGELTQVVAQGLEGGPLTPEHWEQFREYATSRYPELFEKTHASWAKFYENGNPPVGNSYEVGYVANSEATELQMDFNHSDEGYTISLERMAGHVAFGSGGEFHINPNTPMLVTIGPRDLELSHEVITAVVSPDHVLHLPDDIGDQIMTVQDGRVMLKDGWMITADRNFGGVNAAGHGDTTILGHTAAQFNPGEATITGTPDVVESYRILGAEYNPPSAGTPEGPIPIPIDARRPIGNVRPGANGEVREEETPPTADSGETMPGASEIIDETQTIESNTTPLSVEAPATVRANTTEAITPVESEEAADENEQQGFPESNEDQRAEWRLLTGQAHDVRQVATLPYERRQQALIDLRQNLIENDVIQPEQAFFTIDGKPIAWDQLTESQSVEATKQLAALADDISRRAIAIGGRRGSSSQENEGLPEAA